MVASGRFDFIAMKVRKVCVACEVPLNNPEFSVQCTTKYRLDVNFNFARTILAKHDQPGHVIHSSAGHSLQAAQDSSRINRLKEAKALRMVSLMAQSIWFDLITYTSISWNSIQKHLFGKLENNGTKTWRCQSWWSNEAVFVFDHHSIWQTTYTQSMAQVYFLSMCHDTTWPTLGLNVLHVSCAGKGAAAQCIQTDSCWEHNSLVKPTTIYMTLYPVTLWSSCTTQHQGNNKYGWIIPCMTASMSF